MRLAPTITKRERLAKLRDQGAITPEEYEQAKRKALRAKAPKRGPRPR